MENTEPKLSFTPREAVQHIVGAGAGNQSKNHVWRDVQTLVRAGLRPQKICGRWVIPRGELERWASGQVQPSHEPASQARRRPGRPRKQTHNGGAL